MPTPRSIQAHGVKCPSCGMKTYRLTGMCEPCEQGRPPPMPPPSSLDERYLMRCAEELLRRHQIREGVLRQLGMKGAA